MRIARSNRQRIRRINTSSAIPARLSAEALAYEVRKQDRRKAAAELCGDAFTGMCAQIESPDKTERMVHAELARCGHA